MGRITEAKAIRQTATPATWQTNQPNTRRGWGDPQRRASHERTPAGLLTTQPNNRPRQVTTADTGNTERADDMLATILDRLRKRQAAATEDALATYRQLCERLVDETGKPPTEAEADKVLTAAGRTVDELEADVALLRDRKRWAATLAEEPEVLKGLAPIEQQLETERRRYSDRLKTLQQEHADNVAALTARQSELLTRQNAINNARVRLQETHPAYRQYIALTQQAATIANRVHKNELSSTPGWNSRPDLRAAGELAEAAALRAEADELAAELVTP